MRLLKSTLIKFKFKNYSYLYLKMIMLLYQKRLVHLIYIICEEIMIKKRILITL